MSTAHSTPNHLMPDRLTSSAGVERHDGARLSSRSIERVGALLLRYGLVLVIAWIGAMKFTAVEAEGIRPLVENSPMLAWTYDLLSVREFSNILGGVEIGIAVLIALRTFSPRLSAVGSALAVGMFLTTLSFLLTTPPVWDANLGGFPAISILPGQFLLKDLVLIGAAIWTLGEAMTAMRADSATSDTEPGAGEVERGTTRQP